MKKILFSVAALIYTLLVALSSSAQSAEVPAEVQNSFNAHFKNVQLSRWVAIQDSHVATFTMDGQNWRDAYFTNDGEFKGVGRYITFDQLPISVQEKLNSDYTKYEIMELYQFDCTETGICFFATLRNEKNNITLKLDDLGYVAYSRKDKIKQPKQISEPLASADKKH
jgi:opacity protein-like surface antigen